MTPPLVEIDLSIEDPRWDAYDLPALCATAASMALAAARVPDAGYLVSVLACDDARITELNGTFRDKPRPTNILSWPATELAAGAPGDWPAPPPPPDDFDNELGDLALAFETCIAEAEAAGLPVAHHLTHLLLHGCLHLLGFDHETEADAALMEGLEIKALASAGIANPY
ncbi:rRNA maturation RNase YbeY [Oceanomicrobium pacificus]|uniref:Endoribonuclease YbeY n=1 Tax=Oceanomicrobium pacificus TaxID=2692916 RepID=A0A6B0TU07_9RHOB|nr:rRNA maturation RNase YbeY [Oceanomicrobium pacificus]MXU64443.1 rRNA maturation RNase YbeY [Oceanomicrobium pacificus]